MTSTLFYFNTTLHTCSFRSEPPKNGDRGLNFSLQRKRPTTPRSSTVSLKIEACKYIRL